MKAGLTGFGEIEIEHGRVGRRGVGRGRAERREEEVLDQFARQLAAAAVAEHEASLETLKQQLAAEQHEDQPGPQQLAGRAGADPLRRPSVARRRSEWRSVDQFVNGSAVRADLAAGFVQRDEHPRMGVPQAHTFHGAMQGQVRTAHLVVVLRIGLDELVLSCSCSGIRIGHAGILFDSVMKSAGYYTPVGANSFAIDVANIHNPIANEFAPTG